MNRLQRFADQTLDFFVLPGFAASGFAVRRHFWVDEAISDSLTGRRFLVTGASSGIGEAASLELARRGAEVAMVVRDPAKGQNARDRIAAADSAAGKRTWLELCDISDLDSVGRLAERLLQTGHGLTGILHNAGVLTPERQRNAQAHELTFATAVIGPFAMTRALRPALEAGAPARVVFMSSGGMYTAALDGQDLELERRAFDGPRFYAHAKRAQVVLAEQFAKRWGPDVSFASMHPGWADTPGVKTSLPRFHRLLGPILRTPAQAADTAVWLLAGGAGELPAPGFFHDRRRRTERRLPSTRTSETTADALWDHLDRLAPATGVRGE